MARFLRSTSTSHAHDVAVVIRVESGSFVEGFPVTLQILEDGKTIETVGVQEGFCLPPAPEMPKKYREWKGQSNEGSRQLQARLLDIDEQAIERNRLD